MKSLTDSVIAQDEILVAELHRLEVRHLARFAINAEQTSVSPVNLIAALTAHPDARFQAALILLFLRRPDCQQYLTEALERLFLKRLGTYDT